MNSQQRPLDRRRALRMIGAAAGLAVAEPGLVLAGGAGPMPRRWQGVALGARASIGIYHPDEREADRLIRAAVAEIRRLEGVFSLYRPDSAVSLLNHRGRLDAPPPELVRLLAEAERFSDLTGGAFDVTVQPLWEAYARHFSRPDADPSSPPPAAVLQRARALVDYRRLTVAQDRIAFGRPGMKLTLNGIAQGFVTDRVAELLRAGGLDSVLIDLGEIRGIGRHPDRRPWSVGLQDPDAADRVSRTVEIADAAVATSAGAGHRFDPAGRFHHLFDPRTGASAGACASVSVIAPTATEADALSTAFAVKPPAALTGLDRRLRQVTAFLTAPDGRTTTWRSAG